MKKVLFLLAASVGLAMSAHAQTGKAYTFPLMAGDTLVNVDSVSKVITTTAGYSVLGIQVNLKKISGTVAGKAYLFQSFDGANYQLIDSAAYNPVPTWSFVNTAYTHTAQFTKTSPPGVYYIVLPTSSGTVSAVAQVMYTSRKYQISQ